MSVVAASARRSGLCSRVFVLMLVLAVSLVWAALSSPAFADGVELPRYWAVESLREGSPQAFAPSGDVRLYLRFAPQEDMCSAKYGDQWYDVCARPTGFAGRPAPGAALEPAMPGVWRWTDDRQLTFIPSEPWPAGTRYTVNLPENSLPPSARLTHPLAFVTEPVEITGRGSFQFDPRNPREMAVSGVFLFNYPMRRESVSVSATLDGGNALIGEPVFLWNESGSTLRFSVPVRALDETGRTLRLAVARGCTAVSGGEAGEGVELNISLPSRHELFQLNGAEAVVATGGDMRARQVLALEFSLPVSAREARKALNVKLLPRQKAESAEAADSTAGDGRPPYSWWSMAEVTPEVLARSRAVSLTLPEDPDAAFSTLGLGFGEELEPGRYLLITLGALTSKDGFSSRGGTTFFARVPEFPEALRILQKGNVLTLGGDGKLSLYSRSLDSVRWKAWQVRSSFINQFAGMNGGDFSEPELSETTLNALSVLGEGEIPLVRRNAASPQFSALDLAPLLADRADGRRGLFVLQLTGWRDGQGEVASDRRFVLVTDMGLIRKTGADGSGAIYAVSLSSGEPASGVDVRVIGANGLPVFEARSDEQGKVNLPALSGLRDDKAPVAVVAERKGDLAFLPWGGWAAASLETDFSRFDVYGERETEGGLNVFLFGERDMYRPGENAHMGYIVRQSGGAELKGLPLRAELRDPRGNTAASWDLHLPESGMGELEFPIATTAPTGLYNFVLRLRDDSGAGEYLRDLSFRVEEFQPDTLRLNVGISPRPAGHGWLRVKDVKQGLAAELLLENLFGAPASGARATGELEVSSASFSFSEYPGWRFYDAARLARSSSRDLGETETGADGTARFALPAEAWTDASCRLNVMARGFEPGSGRGVTAHASVMVSPLEYVLGWKSASDLSWLPQGGAAELSLLAVDSTLSPRAVGEVTLETLGVTWAKTLIRHDGLYRYENVRRETPLASARATLGAEERKIRLDTSTPGEKILVVRAADGATLTRIPYVVAGTAPVLSDALRDPVLRVNLDKKDYGPGETMKIMLTTPYKGAGLITVERERVLAEHWFRAEGGTSVQEIVLPSDFEGKAYLNVTYFRSPDDKDIFTRPHAALAQPFTINMERRDLGVSLEPRLTLTKSGEAARPGGDLAVELRAKRACKAVVFAVDEGVLQLTGFKTPNPLKAMLGDRALQVKTSQYFDLLMPEYGLLHAALAAYGGGEALMDAAAMGQNPFRRPGEKSVAFWSGIVDAGPEARVVNIPLPEYFSGQLRLMAVAYSADPAEWGMSSCRKDVKVQAEVVLRPSFPLFVAPGDEFEASLTLTDMSGFAPEAPVDTSAEVRGGGDAVPGRRLRLSVEPGAGLELLSPPPAEVELYHARSRTVTMRLRATDRLGGSRAVFRVAPRAGEEGNEVTRSAALSVRPATPRAAVASFGRMAPSVAPGGPAEVWTASRKLHPEFSAFSATASALPLPPVRGFMGYLNAYPYGCTEQLTSAAFPALVMLTMPEFMPRDGSLDAEKLHQAVRDALSMLAARNDGSWSFSVWPGSWAHEDLLLSTYVADFLTTAKDAGVMPPYGLERRLLAGLEEAASSMPGSLHDARVRAYAAWVLTRNGVLTSNILATLDAWLNRHVTEDGKPAWSGDIAAVFMGGCWQLMMQPEQGRKLVEGFKPDPVRAWSPGDFDGLAARAFYLSVLAGQFPDMLKQEKAQSAVDDMLALASSGSFTTFSAAQASRAMLAYARALNADMAGAGEGDGVKIEALDASGTALAQGNMTDGMARIALERGEAAQSPSPAAVASLRVETKLPLFWDALSVGFDAVLPASPEFRGMEVAREIRDKDGNTVMDGTGRFLRTVKQGEELIMILHVRAYDRSVENVAVSDLLAGGLEMIVAEGGDALDAGLRSIPGGTRAFPLDPDYVERREDRMLLFTPAATRDGVFAYRVRAVSRGEFVLPPLRAEAMYDPRLSATSAAGRMVVE